MSVAGEPDAPYHKSGDSKANYTEVKFYPDLKRFGMDSLDDDIVSLFSRRAFDLAGTIRGVKVRLNGDLLPVRNRRVLVFFAHKRSIAI